MKFLSDADRLMEEAGGCFVKGSFNLADVENNCCVEVSSPGGQFRLNSPAQVEAAIRQAIEATDAGDVRRAVKALTRSAGVEVKMASAILTAMFPTRYTVCDFRASRLSASRTTAACLTMSPYLAACRGMAAQYGVSLRNFDRANWQWSKDRDKEMRKHEGCRH